MKAFHLFKTVFGKIPSHHYQDTFDVDCIVGFSFGQERSGKKKIPGKSNEMLAKIANLYSKGGQTPLILQWEIAESCDLLIVPKEKVIREKPPAEYIDTYEVAVEAMKHIHEMGYKKVMIIAHQEHTFRCKRVLESLTDRDIEFVVPSILKAVPYSYKSKHIQTKSVVVWQLYEVLARALYIKKGYMK